MSNHAPPSPPPLGQNCSSDGYGNTGCIGTAVHTHSTVGGLPMTGLDGAVWALIAATILALILVGLSVRHASDHSDRKPFDPWGN